MYLDYFLLICAGILGAIIGSFLNVVIFRLETEESMGGRSHCQNCRHVLAWFELIPVFSFLFLAGRCRKCHAKISIQYPFVELATGLIFLLIFNLQLPIINTIFLWYVVASLIVIFAYDLRHYLIPDLVLFPAIGVTILYQLFYHFQFFVTNSLWAGLGASAFFFFFYVISRGKWMGFGDVKLAILLGLLLGFPNIIVGLTLSFFLGAIIGLATMFFQGKNLKSQLPFAPFLITGTLIALFFGEQIINWYFSFFIF